jgi:multimeric flavodoxin WrbA
MVADEDSFDFSDLNAMFFNGTLSRSPEPSHTDRLIAVVRGIMERHGVATELIRTIDTDIATGMWPDMREHGWQKDDWPEVYERVKAAQIVVIAGPIWLGDNSSETKKIIERFYSVGHDLNERGQYAFMGKVGGCIISGNEDGVKHCAMNILYSLQHLSFTIPPTADAGWIGDIGPGPSYGDELPDGSRVGFDSEFTNRNLTFLAWNLMHMARLLKDAGGLPAYGNVRRGWDAGERYDFSNPEYR